MANFMITELWARSLFYEILFRVIKGTGQRKQRIKPRPGAFFIKHVYNLPASPFPPEQALLPSKPGYMMSLTYEHTLPKVSTALLRYSDPALILSH